MLDFPIIRGTAQQTAKRIASKQAKIRQTASPPRNMCRWVPARWAGAARLLARLTGAHGLGLPVGEELNQFTQSQTLSTYFVGIYLCESHLVGQLFSPPLRFLVKQLFKPLAVLAQRGRILAFFAITNDGRDDFIRWISKHHPHKFSHPVALQLTREKIHGV